MNYPFIDVDELIKLILSSKKVASSFKHGDVYYYILNVTSKINKRLISFRILEDNQVPFFTASGIALRLGFAVKFYDWLKENKDWVEGEYTK